MKKIIVLLSLVFTAFVSNAQGVSTFAGSGTGGYADGTGTAAQFNKPWGVAVDAFGNVYVSDNNRIRKITPAGVVSAFAGSGVAGYLDGNSTTANFNNPQGVCCDSSGNIFVSDSGNNRIRKITAAGVVSTLAGSGVAGFADGTGIAAQFKNPIGVAIDASGNLYVADSGNNRIRKITISGVVTTKAGSGVAGYLDGNSKTANFNTPKGVCIDLSGNIFVADTNNHRIRKISSADFVTTFSTSCCCGNAIGKICNPTSICIDNNGDFYVSASYNQDQVLKVYSNGYVSEFVGYGFLGYLDGWGADSRFYSPNGISLNNSGNYLFVADTNNNRIRKVLVCNVTASINYSSSTFCKSLNTSQPVVLTGTGAYTGGTFSSTAGLTINPSTGAITPSESNPGTYTVSYNINSSTQCMSTPALTQITITALPTASISYPGSPFCNSLTYVQVVTSGTGAYTGGAYTSTTGLYIIASTGEINPYLSSPGTYTVTYNTSSSGGCAAISVTSQVTVTAFPTTNISYSGNPFCKSLTAVQATKSGTSSYTGGNYTSVTGLSINAATGTINPSLSTAGTYSVTYTIPASAGCPSSFNTTSVVILPAPTASISADGVVTTSATITNGSAIPLQLNGTFNMVPNIQWTPAIGISSTSVANPVVYPSTTTTYTASFVNSNGCSQTTSFTVNVTPQPNIGNLSISSPNATIGVFDTVTVNVQLTNATDLYSLYMKLKGNAAVNQYLDYTGYTAGTLLGVSNVISTPPTVTNGVPDFGMTKVGAVPGYAGSGLFYTFTFVPKNIVIPAGTAFCFYLDDVSAYNTSGIPCGLTNQGQYYYTFTNQVTVWPGDLNKSNTVTTADILPIGYFYNSTGPARSNANIQWTAQPATLWGYNHSATNGDAYKVFADSNGDGVINNADQAAIGFNMNKIHARLAAPITVKKNNTSRLAVSSGSLVVTPNTTIVNASLLPQTVTFTVNLNNSGGLSALYGISVNLVFDETIFDLATATLDYKGSIFGATGTDCLVMNYASGKMVSVGLTRYSNAAINGQGLLFKVTLQTKSTLTKSLTQTPVTAYVDAANNQTGDTLVVQDAPLTNFTIINNLGVDTIKQDEFVLYPNPASEVVCLVLGTNTAQLSGLKLKVFNILGQTVNELHIENSTMEISTKNWGASGMYFMQVTNENNTVLMTEKVIVNRK